MKKNILHINHISRTWSGNVIKNIIAWLDKNNFSSHILVWYDFDNYPNTDSVYKTSKSIFYKQVRYKLLVWLNFLFDIMTPWSIDIKSLRSYKPYLDADIIHIHCPQWGYFNRFDLPIICKEKKVIMTLHDDWLIAWNDNNNSLFQYKTKSSYEKRKTIFEKVPIVYIGVSDRMNKKIAADPICGLNTVQTIYNGIDTTVFLPLDKIEARKILWLPLDKKIILSIAWSGGKSNLKWLSYVKKIQDHYHEDSMLFVTLWNWVNKRVSNFWREIWYVPSTDMRLYFCAADCFLYPTLADNFPLVVEESIACGCPVVTFDTWWIPEIVQHKKNWYIAKYKDLKDLSFGFEWVMKNKDIVEISLNSNFTQEAMVEQYSNLYRNILKSNSP